MKHDLLLGIYTFQIKTRNKSDKFIKAINDFLEEAYPYKDDKFKDGFCADIRNSISEVVKSNDGSQGALFHKQGSNLNERYYDIMLDGGNTGIQQFIVDENTKETTVAGKDKIIGPRFFGRFWLPSSSNTAYVFIQSYHNINIKGVFDAIISNVLDGHNMKMVPGRLVKTTTVKRHKDFIKNSIPKSITLVKPTSAFSTDDIYAEQVEITLKNIDLPTDADTNKIMAGIKKLLGQSNITIENEKDFTYTTIRKNYDDNSQRKTALELSENDINFIPRIRIDADCVDENNHPIFQKLREFVDEEIESIKSER